MKAGERVKAPVTASMGGGHLAAPYRSASADPPVPGPTTASGTTLPGFSFAGLALLPPGDEREIAAERIARRIAPEQSNSPAPPPPDRGGKLDLPHLPRVPAGSGGAPLDGGVRRFLEHQLGWNFAGVRIHTGEDAARSVDALGAVAATSGSNITFARDRYEPGTTRGRALLAHELVHVAQQAAGTRVVARQGTEQYQTSGITLDRDVLEDQARHSYWELKLRAEGFIPAMMDQSTQVRLAMDGEELHAVMGALHQARPQGRVTQDVVKILQIPKRRGTDRSMDITYQVTYEAQARPGHTLRAAPFFFVGEGRAGTPVTPDAPSTSFQTKIGSHNVSGFPNNNDSVKYWQAHTDEQRRVFNWIEKGAPRRFDQLLATPTASFQVKGEKDTSDNVTSLVITFLGATTPTQQAPPPDYLKHDFSDKDVEDLRATADPLLNDRLGAITGIEAVPEGERGAVKFAVVQYFKSRPAGNAGRERKGTRNAEVDAIVPIQRFAGAGRRRSVLYTFRFRPSAKDPKIQDAEVQRIGEEGVDVGISVRTPRGRLSQVNGFAEHNVGATEDDRVKSLVKWLTTRYPAVKPAPTNKVGELEIDVNRQIRGGSKDPAWFETNYGMKILNKADATDWMKKGLGMSAPEDLQDIKEFTQEELALLEVVLERMSDSTLSRFHDVRLTRQNVFFKFVRKGVFEREERVAGVTRGGAKSRTITIFDAATDSPDALFTGGLGPDGKPVAMAAAAIPIAHEFGHVISYEKDVQKKFDVLVKAKNIKPITWYAGSDPPQELFPEAFALFHTDPEWLRNNWPDLFDFFAALDKRAVLPSPGKAAGKKKP